MVREYQALKSLSLSPLQSFSSRTITRTLALASCLFIDKRYFLPHWQIGGVRSLGSDLSRSPNLLLFEEV